MYGRVALLTCLIELIGIWGTTAITAQMPQKDFYWLVRPMAVLYVAGLASIPVAVIGLLKDTRRAFALVALVLGLVNTLVCGIRFIAA